MSRLLHLVALLALSLAPVAMHGAPAAAAAPQHEMRASAHCGGGEQSPDDEDRGRAVDCAIACSAMPCGSGLIEPVASPRAAYAGRPTHFFAGSAPESDPPPPRLA